MRFAQKPGLLLGASVRVQEKLKLLSEGLDNVIFWFDLQVWVM